MISPWGLHLFKQNLKFSSAHFLIFDAQHAERLHGHNYQVQLEVFANQRESQVGQGYLVDFGVLKKRLKVLVDEWDEHILLPDLNPEFKKNRIHNGTTTEVYFRDRYYAFPTHEVIWLPITNTSVEQLAFCLSQKMLPDMQGLGLSGYQLRIDETPGQGAHYYQASIS